MMEQNERRDCFCLELSKAQKDIIRSLQNNKEFDVWKKESSNSRQRK